MSYFSVQHVYRVTHGIRIEGPHHKVIACPAHRLALVLLSELSPGQEGAAQEQEQEAGHPGHVWWHPHCGHQGQDRPELTVT